MTNEVLKAQSLTYLIFDIELAKAVSLAKKSVAKPSVQNHLVFWHFEGAWRAIPSSAQVYSWLCTVVTPRGSRDYMGCWGSNPDQLHTRQGPYPPDVDPHPKMLCLKNNFGEQLALKFKFSISQKTQNTSSWI